MLVLVLDDEAATRTILSDFLSQHGFDVVSMGWTEDALSRTTALQPDIFIIDMAPRGASGVDVATTLRERGFAHTPMIAISNSAVMLQVAGLYDLFQASLQKPLDLDQLFTRIKELASASE